MLYNEIKHIIKNFKYNGAYKNVDNLTSGLINSTYKLTYTYEGTDLAYVLQKINKFVFKDPDAIMNNIKQISDHINLHLDKNDPSYSRRYLQFIETTEGGYLYKDDNGDCWRSYVFIDNATAYNEITEPYIFYEVGKGFGEFQKRLVDFPAEALTDTIPNFHNTKQRFYDFVAAVAADKAGRVSRIEKEIDFLFDRRKKMNAIVDRLERGEIPVRVTHNDTKLNNVLIDNTTHKAICVIDLDTVMSGSSLYDYGDAIRYGASTASEDEADLSKITLDMELFRLFTKGFLSETADVFEKEEILSLPLGVEVMTCELAMRFLTDYINGDVYFKTNSPEHNLIRARAQMRLLEDIESKHDEMTNYIKSLI